MDQNSAIRESLCKAGLFNEPTLTVNSILVVSVLKCSKKYPNYEVIWQVLLLISAYLISKSYQNEILNRRNAAVITCKTDVNWSDLYV